MEYWVGRNICILIKGKKGMPGEALFSVTLVLYKVWGENMKIKGGEGGTDLSDYFFFLFYAISR